LLFKPDRQTFPPIPQSPSKDDAVEALAALKVLVEGFPFISEVDRAVSLSGILTTLDRRAMATAPLHAFTAPAAGTGKSLLIDLFAILATGRPMPVIAQGRNEEELEKRLGAALLAGDAAISLDNCDHPLESAFLCQALTQGQLNIRLLGYSQNIETPVNATIFANGNNLVIVGDLVRRALMSTMDAKCEQPELRTFNVNIIEVARAKRGELVVAGLTILRAWQLARESEQGGQLPPFGGFERWSQRVREPLVWLGCSDPCESVAKVRSNDPEREALQAVITQWKENLGVNTKYLIKDVIDRAVNVGNFYTALLNVAASRTGGLVSNDRLGRWLKRMQGKMVNGLRLLQDGNDRGYPLWKLTDQ
jgi:putative DNA primase/helicase